jgi:dipeptidyl aminopeptidase/acylaminoacyl peptidase
MMFRLHTLIAAAAAAVLVAACGGGGDDDARGSVAEATLVTQATKAQIDAGTAASGLQPLSGLARCSVDVRHVVYVTRDPAGAPAYASTAVMVPAGTDAACTGERPVVVYTHGTTTTKSKNLASSSDSEAQLVLAMYAAQGYIVVAPNYLGYDRS